MEKVLLTLDETAALLGVSRRAVYRMIQLKTIPKPLRVGSRLKFRRTDIDTWIEAGCPEGKGNVA